MNAYIKELLLAKIRKALIDSKIASGMDHPGLTGRLREILLSTLIKPLLNTCYATGTGKITDYKGAKSKEVDICIYGMRFHPPLFFIDKDEPKLFPIESVLSCIEVKSTLTKKNLEDAYKKFKYLEDNLEITPLSFDNYNRPQNHIFVKHKYDFFAFDSAIKGYTPQYLLDLYKKIDVNWNTDPLITSICIGGNGWLTYTQQGWLHMSYDKETETHEEIIGYLCCLVQSIESVEINRGYSRIGYYLTEPLKMGRFENGKLLKNPWKGIPVTFSTTKLS